MRNFPLLTRRHRLCNPVPYFFRWCPISGSGAFPLDWGDSDLGTRLCAI